MKKKVIAAAVAATLGHTAANAVSVNPNGLGEVLLFPYYTTQAGTSGNYDTLLTIVNTTNRTKAVKVRFLEAKNSFEVLDFNLYLSPRDVWVGVLTQVESQVEGEVGNAVTKLITPDNSCTVPAIPAGGVEFRNLQFADNADGGNLNGGAVLERTLEGYFEVIEMGVVIDDVDGFIRSTWATHGSNGVPADCASLNLAWQPGSGTWSNDRRKAILPPTGGLFGTSSIINVSDGTDYGYDAVSLSAFFVAESNLDVLHSGPGSLLPNLTSVKPKLSQVVEGNTIVTSTWDTPGQVPVAPVSAVLMKAFAADDYATDNGIQAETALVFTMPTKREHLRPTVSSPFTTPFENGQACETVDYLTWDREEQRRVPVLNVDFSPQPVIPPQFNSLCFEANVVNFNHVNRDPDTATSALGSTLVNSSISDAFENGWVRADFASDLNHQMIDDDAVQYRGLPVIGFSVQRYFNQSVDVGNGQTSLSHYGGLFNHKTSTAIFDTNGVQIAGHDVNGDRVVLSQ